VGGEGKRGDGRYTVGPGGRARDRENGLGG